MEINAQKKFFSERDALILLMEETSKAIDQMDMTLIKECLYFLYPENEEEDRAYIERTLPILHEKLGFNHPAKAVRRSRPRMALVAVLIILGVLMLASVVAYAAFGISIFNFFIYGTDEYWMIHVKTPEGIETVVPDSPASLTDYDVWGEAVARSIEELNVYPALPKILPDGYEYVSTMDTGIEGFYSEWTHMFEHSDGSYIQLVINVRDVGGIDSKFFVEKDERTNQITIHDDYEIAFSQNFESVSATWMSGNCNISIIGTCSMEVLKAMMASI